jgi:type IV pilus assembly protein PilW
MSTVRRTRVGVSNLVASDQRGLSLVELLVAMAINLALIIAAASLYLNTRESQRAIDQAAAANEAGVFALRTIGRDLMNAGFYPAISVEQSQNYVYSYPDITGGVKPGLATGIYGCDGATFNMTNGTCGAAVAGAPDSVIVAYFTNDAFGTMGGQRTDCTGADVSTALDNAARVGTGPANQPPLKPLLVANAYTLTSSSNNMIDGRNISTKSLACQGNASVLTGQQLQLVAGLEQLKISYAPFDNTRKIGKYYTASQVSGLADIPIDGKMVKPWARIAAVRVCVIAKTYEANASMGDSTGQTLPYTDCDGQQTAPVATDRAIYKTYTQVFGLRNYLNKTY